VLYGLGASVNDLGLSLCSFRIDTSIVLGGGIADIRLALSLLVNHHLYWLANLACFVPGLDSKFVKFVLLGVHFQPEETVDHFLVLYLVVVNKVHASKHGLQEKQLVRKMLDKILR